MMNICQILVDIALAVAKEAERNAEFRANIERALGISEEALGGAAHHSKAEKRGQKEGSTSGRPDSPPKPAARAGNRRAPATLDPVQLARDSEGQLRERLSLLSIDQLRDIVAEYGMDTGGLVAKWKTSERIIERIVEVAMQRAKKGNAFREQDQALVNQSSPASMDHEVKLPLAEFRSEAEISAELMNKDSNKATS